ncbi:MAG TPA: nucleotide sugar dehydrogenase [Thermoanaerobaculia bacterium]|nr:nucleotide sugar dehydrogenase [Thermoanaerobaculia bacterium]
MRVCVFGLWHLGTVTAACLASLGHEVAGLDPNEETVARLENGEPPLYEPGLADLVVQGLQRGALRFTTDAPTALDGARVLWVTFDTPVDEDDRANAGFVVERIESLFDHLAGGTLVLVSSQLPAGSVAQLEASYAARGRPERVMFAASPENLRLGKAIDAFLKPDRIIVGARTDEARRVVSELLEPLRAAIEWMSVESAEMTKHALNAFLATSVAFINEIAGVCERVGADARDVARGLKTDARIGPRAYLSPGGAFAGGTLARDITFLTALAGDGVPLIESVKTSNDRHRNWTRVRLLSILGGVKDRSIAVWGLTYKPGTDTLRRSGAVELCRWLTAQGARVRAHDPAVKRLPDEGIATLCSSASEAVSGADALVIATEWPEYRTESVPAGIVVIDANRFIGAREGVRYYSVGAAS